MPYISAVMLAALLVAAFAFAPRREIVTEVEIDADPGAVWAVLAHGASYADWNPFIRSMQGELRPGAVLENVMMPEEGRQMTFRPRVLVAEAGRELRWLGRLFLPRIFDGEHYFILRPQGQGTRLVHGERFAGVLLWAIPVERFRRNFEELNAALKRRVEDRAKRNKAGSQDL